MYRFRQFRLLLWKNFLLQFRRPIGTCFEILLPVVFVAILILPRLLLDPEDKCFSTFSDSLSSVNLGTLQSDIRVLANNGKGKDDKAKDVNMDNATLAYYPSTAEIDKLMQSVKEIMNMSHTVNRKAWKSEEDMAKDVTENEDIYYGAVAFLGNLKDYQGQSLPTDIKYAIRLPAQKWTNDRTYPRFRARGPQDSSDSAYSSRFIFVQYALDAAIHQRISNSSQPYRLTLKQFPYPPYRQDFFNTTVANMLPLLFTLAFIFTAMMIVKELVYEKQCRLKESMKMMGLSNWLHWLSWFAKCFIFSLISIVLVTIVLKVFKIFEHSDGTVIFVFLLLYMVSGIMFCFCVSVFFSNAVLSMLFSGSIWFITYVPFSSVSNENTYDGLSSSAKSAICLLVNSCLGIGAKSFSVLEERGVGVQWSNLASSPSADDDFSMAQVFVMFIVEILMYGFITWYVEAVFPGDYGIPLPPYFLFTKSYWFGTGTARVQDGQETAMSNLHLKTRDYEEEPTDLEVGVSICKMKKVFKSAKGKKIAVDDLSFNMFKGQITSLLGHNGAGKTTTMSVLTGLFPPTSGGAYINGYNILTDMDRVRDSLGLCPQHNVLFDKLTVKEHLKFFINLKGKFGTEAEQEIETMIQDIQLSDKAGWQSRLLSGGMKRKLSCAIALIGDSEIVFLDEPTSGMDPYARRATWDLLQKYRAGKTIILTTHFMDEADFLGDRIAIMADGQLKCCGSSLFLKSRYGVGYRLTLVKAPECDVTATQSLVYNHVKDAQLVSDVGAELVFVLPSQSSGYFEQLFREIEERRDALRISSFGVSITTLEDVFIKVGEGLEHTVDEIVEAKEAMDDGTAAVDLVHDNTSAQLEPSELLKGVPLKIHQFKAMFMKRFLHSKRNKAAVISQFILPLLFTILALVLARTVPKVTDEPSRLLNFKNLSVDGKTTKTFFTNYSARSALSFTDVETYLKTMSSSSKDITTDVKLIKERNSGNHIYIADDKQNLTADNREACCKLKYLIINEQCKDLLADQSNAPATGNNKTCTPAGYKDCEKCMKRGHEEDTCPYAIADTGASQLETFFEEYMLRDSDAKEYYYDHVAGFMVHDHYDGIPIYTTMYSNEGIHTIADSVNVMGNMILRTANDSYSITAYNHPLPYNSQGKTDNVTGDFSALLLAIFINFGMSFLVASFITFLIQERESKAKHIQFISGVDTVSFWSATYAWDFINYMIPAIFVLILFAIFQVDAYSGENIGAVFFLLILQGLAAIPFVYCMSYLFKSPLIGYALTVLILSFLSLGLLIAVFILDATGDTDIAEILKYISLLLPTFAFSNSFLDINKNYGLKKQCTESPMSKLKCDFFGVKYVDNVMDWDDFGVGKQCLYLAIEAVVYFALCLLLQVNFFISAKTHDSLAGTTGSSEPEDEDVLAERRRVDGLDVHCLQDAVVVKNITKVYPGADRTAVDNLSLGIAKGNCFGLLGINGAGKTTTFGMLTGEFPISAGTAYLEGFNIQTQLRQVQQRIGYCPQFDALVDKLTGREMLQMYAHLRGVPSSKMKDLVDYTIDSLNLGKWADKMCGTYSGGNKRKLSTAIALVGNPPIVFLDEPTTGMDPGARRFLWDYLTSVIQGGRSIVLTSHSMEECEALCTQLAIMVNGKFKCLGGIQHLKSRFGYGYTLMLKISAPEHEVVSSGPPSPIAVLTDGGQQAYFNPSYDQPDNVTRTDPAYPTGTYMSTLDGHIEQAKLFVQQTFPGAFLQESRQGMLTYQVVGENLSWSYIFGALEKSRERLRIVDYSVSQTTLEQVFLNFAKHQFSEERTKLKKKCLCF